MDTTTKKPRTKTAKKQLAQELLMHGIGNVLGYWTETNALIADQMTQDEQEEFQRILVQQADRVARMFGYEEAWGN